MSPALAISTIWRCATGLLVASVVLVAAEFIQRLVFRFLEKKKSSPSESEEISEEKESGEF